MMTRFKRWWTALTLNERLMYVLAAAFAIGIATRWRFVVSEVAEAFRGIFLR